MPNRYLAKIEFADADGTPQKRAFSSATIVPEPPGGSSPPFTDDPFTNVAWTIPIEPRIAAHFRMRDQVTSGVVESVRTLELNNVDHALDELYNCLFDGYAIRLDILFDGYISSVRTLDGLMEQPEFTDTRVILKFRDRASAWMEGQWDFRAFDGLGGLGGGSDLAGKVKPQMFGKCKQVPLVAVDPANLIYLITDYGPGDSAGIPSVSAAVDALYDAGVLLTAGATYASAADMQATAPAAGQYRVLLPSNTISLKQPMYVRLGSTPVGQLTADATYGPSGCRIGHVLDLLTGRVSDVTNLNNSLPDEPVGIYLPERKTRKEVLAMFMSGVRGWVAAGSFQSDFEPCWPMDPSNVLTAWTPSIPPIYGADIVRSGRSSSMPSNFPSLPAQSVELNYEKLWTVQTSGLAAGVSATTKAYLGVEYRKSVATSDTPALYPSGPVLSSDSLWVPASTSTMDAEVDRQKALFCVHRDFLQIRCHVDPFYWLGGRLGHPVTVKEFPRYGCDVSRTFILAGYDIDFGSNIADVLLWG